MITELKIYKTSSNKTFGYLFSLIFLLSVFFFENKFFVYLMGSISMILFLITLIKCDILKIPNLCWTLFGEKLGIFISPIVIFIIYYVLFIPLGFFLRTFRVDNLKLRHSRSTSFWEKRNLKIQPFKNQF